MFISSYTTVVQDKKLNAIKRMFYKSKRLRYFCQSEGENNGKQKKFVGNVGNGADIQFYWLRFNASYKRGNCRFGFRGFRAGTGLG
jgi:hypothetical protein